MSSFLKQMSLFHCTLAFALSVFASFHGCASENLDPNRVWLVNWNEFSSGNINFLYRGNSPTNGSEYAFDELTHVMAQRAAAYNLTFPSQFYYIDISKPYI